jgi:primosomal protein N' (replication factor Y)
VISSSVLRIAVPIPLYRLFDYLAPAGVDSSRLRPGVRVKVPFAKGAKVGVLVATATESELPSHRLKRAYELLDPVPLFPRQDLELLLWLADYYQHPPGETLSAALPAWLRKGRPWPAIGLDGWRLTEPGRALPDGSLTRAPRQAEALALLGAYPQGADTALLVSLLGDCRSILQTLEKKGWVEPCQPPPDPGGNQAGAPAPAPALSPAQAHAVEQVREASHRFGVFLLEGVTGSGKTEVYLSLAEQMLEQGKRAMVLVPEISLTPQLVRRFRRRVRRPMVVLHSALSEGRRARAWLDARQGLVDLVIGTRSAVLTPLPDLGLIVVDEEHDLSFKQQDGLRYSARDTAVARAMRAGCPVVLGSATPSLESLRNAETGRYRRLRLTERAGGATAPRLDLLDIRSVRLEGGMSPVLLRRIGEELAQGNQALVFLNRRGYAPVLTCHACGWVAECPHCDARMTLHLASHLLWCHHCGAQRAIDRRCPACGAADLRPVGQGTERLEQVLAKRFPEAGIARIDRDSTRRKGRLEALLGEIREGRHSLLLGTQMLAKGHHFPAVTLVGVLDVDQGLMGADYRAAERMAQLIVQVAGRAGRAERPGQVLIQTRHPAHPLLQTLVHRGYGVFARQALAERRAAGLPPFAYQALLRAESPREEAPVAFLDEALGLARPLAEDRVELWGPVPAPMGRKAGRTRAHLLLQAPQRPTLQALLAAWVPRLSGLKSASRVRWSLDVDPQELV